MLYAIVGALVIILDQWVKFSVSESIAYATGVKEFIPGVLSLVNIHNDGAAFSILSGSNARIYFIILTGIFTVAVILALASRFISGRVARWSIVLVTAGGLSNCIDRVIYGYVQDMFKVELFNFAVFNVADIFITVFAILFAIAMIFEKDPPNDDEDSILFEKDDEEEDRPSRRRREEKEVKRERRAAKDEELLRGLPKMSRREKFEEEKAEKTSRRERRAKYEEEYEQYKAKRAASPNPAAAAAAASQKAPAHNPADPFAEWEKASAKAAASTVDSPAAKAAGISEFSAPQMRPAARKAVDTSDLPAPAAPVSAAAPARPVEEPAPAIKESKTSSVSVDDFDLDSILNEFK